MTQPISSRGEARMPSPYLFILLLFALSLGIVAPSYAQQPTLEKAPTAYEKKVAELRNKFRALQEKEENVIAYYEFHLDEANRQEQIVELKKQIDLIKKTKVVMGMQLKTLEGLLAVYQELEAASTLQNAWEQRKEQVSRELQMMPPKYAEQLYMPIATAFAEWLQQDEFETGEQQEKRIITKAREAFDKICDSVIRKAHELHLNGLPHFSYNADRQLVYFTTPLELRSIGTMESSATVDEARRIKDTWRSVCNVAMALEGGELLVSKVLINCHERVNGSGDYSKEPAIKLLAKHPKYKELLPIKVPFDYLMLELPGMNGYEYIWTSERADALWKDFEQEDYNLLK